jgi:hypothetical protein
MINTFESVKAMEVQQVTDLTSEFALASKKSFHVFIVPGAGASLDCGEVIEITAKPTQNTSSTTVPLVVGTWNPIVLESIAASAIDLTQYNVYISPIANY